MIEVDNLAIGGQTAPALVRPFYHDVPSVYPDLIFFHVYDADTPFYEEMLRETEYHSSSGITMFGIAAVDTALWDCLGRSLGVPCWRMWGGAHESIPAYAMVGWMNASDEELRDVCREAVAQGFRAVKLKVGYATLEEDLHRIDVARDAVGPDALSSPVTACPDTPAWVSASATWTTPCPWGFIFAFDEGRGRSAWNGPDWLTRVGTSAFPLFISARRGQSLRRAPWDSRSSRHS